MKFKKVCGFFLALTFSLVASAERVISTASDNSEGDFFYTATGSATLGPTLLRVVNGEIAVPPEGLIITASPEGRVDGRISGNFTAREWARIYPNFNMDIYVHTVIETDDGYRIAFDYTGTNNPDSNGTTNTITTMGTFSTGAEPYLWVNEVEIVGIGSVDRASGQFTVNYTEADNTQPDFSAFSAKTEKFKAYSNTEMINDLLQSPFVNHIYSISPQFTSFETFGTTIEEIQIGTAEIPFQGLRYNTLFESRAEGMLNGAMSGIDFLTINPDGSRNLNVRVLLLTDDGAEIQAHYTGLFIPDENGGSVAQIFLKAIHSTPSESYQWAHNLSLIGYGTLDLQTLQMDLDFYELGFMK